MSMAKYSIPRPNELRLVDRKSDLDELKKSQPKIYRWRALIGVFVLLLWHCVVFYCFEML